MNDNQKATLGEKLFYININKAFYKMMSRNPFQTLRFVNLGIENGFDFEQKVLLNTNKNLILSVASE